LKAEGIESQSCIEFGNSFVEIIAVAKRENADLIIMGTHGLGAFKHLLLGSTAERVVRKAPCPVLTVRNPEHEFIHP
ncbi:universal stress protein, partial [Candidatus Sumerlaeota bacterium]|nr:universal stress protein [Candidatus Sumerlaeota bacterium]